MFEDLILHLSCTGYYMLYLWLQVSGQQWLN